MRNQIGATPILILVAIIGGIAFLAISYYAPFQDHLLTSLFPKPPSHALGNPAVTQTVQMVEQSSIPQPTNVKIYGDDRVATVTWNQPSNTNGIVGYVVEYGKTSDGTTSLNKQTIFTTTQIQPLENGVEYTVKVRSVKGHLVTQSVPGTHDPSTFAVADGPVSPAVIVKTTPSSARVDAMRSRLTGFFDDFNNFPAGAFDELKWNHAGTACVEPGKDGQFINGQFHAHNMTTSTCDRDANVSRPRAVFDITGRTEANPGQIEMDVDGIGQPRDVWYIDLIPLTARKNGMPLDVTSHNSSGDDDQEDPGNMLRINQGWDNISMTYYDANRNPAQLILRRSGMPCGDPNSWPGPTYTSISMCDMTVKTAGLSPLPQPSFRSNREHPWIPNVRRHWVIQFSKDRIKLFIDGTLLADAATPAGIKNETKFTVHSTLFSYNTGKQSDTVSITTSMIHWDNFGFNGPAPTTVTHNYLDSSPNGTYPLIATGTVGHEVSNESRTTKINIPDQIGTPIGQARLMFTLQPLCCRGDYHWSSSDHVLVNGKRYNFPDPRLNFGSSVPPTVAGAYIAHSTGLAINPADLKTGQNDIALNIDSGIYNVHLELDYDKNSAPAYTQPKNIFGTALFNSIIQPVMTPSDDYWFVEQYMGIGTPVSHNSPAPSVIPTSNPSPSSGAPSATPSPSPSPTPTPSSKPGDIDGNNKVDIFDYNILLTNFGKAGSNIQGDFDKNNTVDIFDYNILLTNFGK